MSKERNNLKLIDAPVYSYWSALYRSFFSRLLYIDVGTRWKGFGLIYLLLVIAIFSIPFFFRMTYSMHQAFKEQITDPLLKIPVFYIQNGDVVFDKPMPYLINNNKNQTVVIIDTTGKVNHFTLEYPYLSILINKSQIAFKIPNPQLFTMPQAAPPSKSTPIVQPFTKESNLVFDGKKIVQEHSIVGLQYASQLMVYPIIVAIFFSIFIVFFIALGLLGQTFSSIFFSFKVSFSTSCRLLVVGGTPMLLLLIALLTLNNIFIGSGLILFFLLMAYYSFGLYALRSESRQVVRS